MRKLLFHTGILSRYYSSKVRPYYFSMYFTVGDEAFVTRLKQWPNIRYCFKIEINLVIMLTPVKNG